MILADWSRWQAIGFVGVVIVICAVLFVAMCSMLSDGDPRWWR